MCIISDFFFYFIIFFRMKLNPKEVKKWIRWYQNMRRKITKKKLIIFGALFFGWLLYTCLHKWKILCSNSNIQSTIGMYLFFLISTYVVCLHNQLFVYNFQILCVSILPMEKPMEICVDHFVSQIALFLKIVRLFM